jgi:hypothetical protein
VHKNNHVAGQKRKNPSLGGLHEKRLWLIFLASIAISKIDQIIIIVIASGLFFTSIKL